MQTYIPTITYKREGTNSTGVPRWKALFRMPKEDGESKYRSKTKIFYAPKAQVVALAEAWRDEILAIPKNSASMTIAELMDDFYLRCEDRKLSVNTLRRYKVDIDKRIKPYFKQKLAVSLTQREVEDFYRYLRNDGRKDGKGGLSDVTVKHVHVVLHKAYRDAVRRDELLKNPVQVKLPQIHKEDALPFSYAETAKLKQAMEGLDDIVLRAALMLGLHLSLRIGEACGLQWRHISLGDVPMIYIQQALKVDGSYGVPKSRKSKRKIVLTPELKSFLLDYREQQQAMLARVGIKLTDETPVLSNELAGTVTTNAMSARIRKLLIKHNFNKKLSFHNLRHTGATYLLQNGVDIKTVQERLGHATASITLDTYAHVLDGKDAEAAMTMQNVFDEHCVI